MVGEQVALARAVAVPARRQDAGAAEAALEAWIAPRRAAVDRALKTVDEIEAVGRRLELRQAHHRQRRAEAGRRGVIAALPPAAPPVAQPIQRYFKDWLLVCDNGRRCTAKAIPADADDGLAAIGMTVVRDAGPQGALEVSIYKADEPMDPAETVLDDTPLRPPYRKDKAGALHLSGEPAAAFLRKVRGGRVLRGAHTDDGPWVLLNGLSAALLAMDDAQARVGTVTALAKPGAKPASAVLAPPPLPTIHAAPQPPPLEDAKALAAAVRRSQAAALKKAECGGGNTPDDEVEPLSPTEAVVILGCGMGAYQGWSLAFRVPRDAPGRAAPLRLPPAPSGGERRSDDDGVTFTEPDYDPKTATFSTAAKGRGIADCGFSTRWVFDGRDFQLAGHEEQTRCGGQDAEWPVIYRAQVVRAR